MPELPEVEAARRAIEEHCMGKKIVKAMIAEDSKVIEGVSASDFETSILGKTIVSAHRKGKNMWLRLDSPPFPSFQFGMAGAVYIKGVAVTKYKRSAVNDADEWPSKYSKFFVQLDDGLEMSFTDKRRFAKVRLLEDPMVVSPISGLGPDALLEPMAEEEFIGSLNKKKIAIKALLLDQSYISGIGNWIADEVLYQAKIHPMQPASSLSKESCTTLLKCIKEVIQNAVEVDADCSRFPLEWLFHYRWGKKPGRVNGKKIDFITAGGRTSAYVPELQKLNGMQPSKAVDKSKKKASKQKENNDDEQDEDEEDDNDTNEPESGKDPKSVKAKGRKKPVGGGRTSSKRRKSEETDEEDGHDEEDEEDDDVTESKGNSSTSIKSKQVKIAKGKGTNKKSLQSKKKAK